MKQELIDHIKSELDDLELDYRDGAWEYFRDKSAKKTRLIFWRKVMSAAAILVIMLLFVPDRFAINEEKQLADHITVLSQKDKPLSHDIITENIAVKHKHMSLTHSPAHIQNETRLIAAITNEIPAESMRPAMDTAIQKATDTLQVKTEYWAKAMPAGRKRMTIEELLAKDAVPDTEQKLVSTAGSRWGLGISVGQALDRRSKANLSFGTHIAYAINSKISVSSGVFYNELGGIRKNDLPDMKSRTDKVMTGSQASLSGVDIPLEIQIKTNKQFYARVGISAYAITSQRQTFNFSEQKVAVTTYLDDNGKERSETVITSEHTTETVPDEKLKQNKFVGLYNLSIGFEQKINKRNTIAFEPYVKVPVSGYSEQRLNLIQGGLRVKIDF